MAEHGTWSAYAQKCRCVPCVEAGRKTSRENRERRIRETPFEAIPHGSTGYTGYNCRCDVCCEEGRKSRRESRRSSVLPPGDERHGTHNGYANHSCRCELCSEAWASAKRGFDLKRRYGLTVDDYQAILVAQGGVCAICRGPFTRSNGSVDHDHETGRVRGILCVRCNTGIGYAQDSVDLLRAAVDYLQAGKLVE